MKKILQVKSNINNNNAYNGERELITIGRFCFIV